MSEKNNVKKMHLGGWEVYFNGDQQCQNFIKTQCISAETAKYLYSWLELTFVNEKLAEVTEYFGEEVKKRALDPEEIGMPYFHAEPNAVYEIYRIGKSDSYLGGVPPSNFQIPTFDFVAPFQYVGKLSKQQPAFSWLPFDLHLVAPIYLNIDALFVDYSNPIAPKVFDIEALKNTDHSYTNELKANTEVIFEQMFFDTQPTDGFPEIGIPNWIQYPEIPTCPKTNEVMRFVCQFGSDDSIKTVQHNVVTDDDWMIRYFEHLNFWGDGDLFVFFHPESRMACYIIQNT